MENILLLHIIIVNGTGGLVVYIDDLNMIYVFSFINIDILNNCYRTIQMSILLTFLRIQSDRI